MLMFQDQKDTKESWEKRGLNTKMIDVTTQILKFRDFLVHSWPDLDLLMENHDWDDDGSFTEEWLQVNWEFLVERQLLRSMGFLKPYFFSQHRITHPKVAPTHHVLCVSKNNHELIDDKTGVKIPFNTDLLLGFFVKKMGANYGMYPPFDYLVAYTTDLKNCHYISVNSLSFYMSKLSS